MSSIKRGEVLEVHPDPSVGEEIQKKRPCIIVSSETFNQNSNLAVVIPLTDADNKKEDIMHIMVLRKEGGLSKNSIALCDQVKAVDQIRLDTKLGNINATTMSKIDKGLRAVLGL